MFSKHVAYRLGCIFFICVSSASWCSTPLFEKARTYNLGMYAVSITVADVNGDGKLDLLVGDGGGAVGVSLGNGDGTFPPAQSYSSGGWRTYAIVVGDVNHDGHLDLIVTSSCESSSSCTHGVVGVLLGNGDKTFRSVQAYDSGGADARSVAVGDMNGDRNLDILIANNCFSAGNCTSGAAGVLLGAGDGTFQSAKVYNSGGQFSSGVAAADVNGDGKLDVLVSNYCRENCFRKGNVGVLFGNGDGTLQAAQSYDTANVNSIAMADLDRDGRPDAILPAYCSHTDTCMYKGLQILMGGSGGIYQPVRTFYPGGRSVTSVAVEDVNRDGKLDVIAGNYCGSGDRQESCGRRGVLGVLLGNGDGGFQKVQQIDPGTDHVLGVAVGDANGDGKEDLIAVNGVVSVLLGTARFTTTTELSSNLSSSVYGQQVSLESRVSSSGPNVPTGTIVFKNGGIALGKVALIDGRALLTTGKLPAGSLSITATYSGDTDSYKSASSAVVQIVTPAKSVSIIRSSRNPSALGEPVTFSFSVTSPTTKVTGTVTFKAGSTILGTVLLSAGTARLTTAGLPAGRTRVTATYAGSANIIGSFASLMQTVNQR